MVYLFVQNISWLFKIGGSDPLLLSLHLLTEADYGTVDIVGIDVIL